MATKNSKSRSSGGYIGNYASKNQAATPSVHSFVQNRSTTLTKEQISKLDMNELGDNEFSLWDLKNQFKEESSKQHMKDKLAE